MHRWKLPAALALATVAVAGCGSSSKSSSNTTSTTKPGVPETTTVPLSVPNDPALRQHAILSTCAASPGGWTASGTIENTTKKDAKYTITVYFATGSGGTIEGTGSTKLDVKAGATGQWKATAQLTIPDPQTTCTLKGVGLS